MWYKSFSIYLLLQYHVNILFQDVDLVWFKEPYEYFTQYILHKHQRIMITGNSPLAFFSDDGQRTHRYTPFFANSGFYYLINSEKAEYFAWSIMTAFDTIHSGGSHQNVFTMRLIEGLGLSYIDAKLLPLQDFPTGIMYHHDEEYMLKLKKHEIIPYNFHM